MVLKRRLIAFLDIGIEEMDPGRIGWIAVADENEFLSRCRRANRLLHGNYRRLSSSVVRHMVGGDFKVFRGDEEKDIAMLPQDLNIRFITRRDGIDRSLVLKIEAMAIKGGCSGIV